MLTCKDVYRFVCERLDQTVDSPRCRAIKRHLKECPDCKEYLASLKKTVVLFRLMPVPGLPHGVHRQLLEKISGEFSPPAPARRTGGKRKKS